MKYSEWSQNHDKVCRVVSAYAQSKGISYVDMLDIINAGVTLGQILGMTDGPVCSRIVADMHSNLAHLMPEVQQ